MGKLRRLTTEEAREIGRKGGKASVKSRRRTKALRMVLKAWTAVKVSEIEDPAIKETFKEAVGTEDVTIGEALVYGCVLSACRGNYQMMRLVFELLEELPEVRQRDKEIKLKEKAAALSQNDDADVIIVLPEKERG